MRAFTRRIDRVTVGKKGRFAKPSHRVWGSAVVAGFTLVAPNVNASPELAAQYDARSVGMAGTGAAFLHNGASVFHNPAGLDGIEQLAVTGVVSPFQPKGTVPLEAPNDSSSSEFQVIPLFLLGGGYRLTDRLVLGLAAYPSTGFGAKFANVQALGGEAISFETVLIEVAPAASFQIADGLSIGASYRITYAQQITDLVVPVFDPAAGSPVPTRTESNLTGTDFVAFGFGVSYAPNANLKLAATYRTQVTTELSGTTTINGQEFDTTSEASAPHRLQLEASHQLFDDRLLVAASFKYLFYEGSNDQVTTVVQTPGGPQSNVLDLNWKNVPGFALGTEYLVTDDVPLRLGYSVAKSATPSANANPFAPGPGWTHGIHGGGGLRMDAFDLDFGAQYLIARGTAEPSTGLAGDYDFDGLVASLSATYHQ
jgi:long-subunit fatty acid transport protein